MSYHGPIHVRSNGPGEDTRRPLLVSIGRNMLGAMEALVQGNPMAAAQARTYTLEDGSSVRATWTPHVKSLDVYLAPRPVDVNRPEDPETPEIEWEYFEPFHNGLVVVDAAGKSWLVWADETGWVRYDKATPLEDRSTSLWPYPGNPQVTPFVDTTGGVSLLSGPNHQFLAWDRGAYLFPRIEKAKRTWWQLEWIDPGDAYPQAGPPAARYLSRQPEVWLRNTTNPDAVPSKTQLPDAERFNLRLTINAPFEVACHPDRVRVAYDSRPNLYGTNLENYGYDPAKYFLLRGLAYGIQWVLDVPFSGQATLGNPTRHPGIRIPDTATVSVVAAPGTQAHYDDVPGSDEVSYTHVESSGMYSRYESDVFHLSGSAYNAGRPGEDTSFYRTPDEFLYPDIESVANSSPAALDSWITYMRVQPVKLDTELEGSVGINAVTQASGTVDLMHNLSADGTFRAGFRGVYEYGSTPTVSDVSFSGSVAWSFKWVKEYAPTENVHMEVISESGSGSARAVRNMTTHVEMRGSFVVEDGNVVTSIPLTWRSEIRTEAQLTYYDYSDPDNPVRMWTPESPMEYVPNGGLRITLSNESLIPEDSVSAPYSVKDYQFISYIEVDGQRIDLVAEVGMALQIVRRGSVCPRAAGLDWYLLTYPDHYLVILAGLFVPELFPDSDGGNVATGCLTFFVTRGQQAAAGQRAFRVTTPPPILNALGIETHIFDESTLPTGGVYNPATGELYKIPDDLEEGCFVHVDKPERYTRKTPPGVIGPIRRPKPK